jgi:hypothetical protein
MTRNIGGVVDLAAYARLAQLHRPTDPEAVAAEIWRPHRTGLTSRDIATALRLPPDDVINVLETARENRIFDRCARERREKLRRDWPANG